MEHPKISLNFIFTRDNFEKNCALSLRAGVVQYAGGTGPTTVITGGVETPNDTGSNTPGGLAPGTTGGAPNDVVVTDGVIGFASGTSEYGENKLAP